MNRLYCTDVCCEWVSCLHLQPPCFRFTFRQLCRRTPFVKRQLNLVGDIVLRSVPPHVSTPRFFRGHHFAVEGPRIGATKHVLCVDGRLFWPLSEHSSPQEPSQTRIEHRELVHPEVPVPPGIGISPFVLHSAGLWCDSRGRVTSQLCLVRRAHAKRVDALFSSGAPGQGSARLVLMSTPQNSFRV